MVGGVQTVVDPGLVPSVHYQSQTSSLQNEATVPHIGGVAVVGPAQTGLLISAAVYHLHGTAQVVAVSNLEQALNSVVLAATDEAAQKSLLAGARALPVDHSQVAGGQVA